MPEEHPPPIMASEEEWATRDNGAYNTETWVQYQPCGCVIPPEEHKALINNAD